MIDLHCHLLPGVDDGAQTLEEALNMARMAVDDGIRLACLTPHLHPERYENNRATLELATQHFQKALIDHEIPLKVKCAAEARLSFELIEMILEDQVPYLGTVDGFRILLLEFPHQAIPVGADKLVSKLFSLKVRPLIAHPERNKVVMSQPDKIFPFVAQGCWLQVTAGSLAGRFGERAAEVAFHLVEQDWATVIASDAHDAKDRPPVLSEGHAALKARFGDEIATRLGKTNPQMIAEGVAA